MTRYQVVSVFDMYIKKLGIDSTVYKTNSLCIGAASNAWHLVLVNNLFIATEVDKNLAACNYIRIGISSFTIMMSGRGSGAVG